MSDIETNETPAGMDGDVPIEPETKRRFTTGTLVMSGLILAAIGGVALIHFRAGPATASASTDTAKTVNTFFGEGKKNMASMQAVLKDTDKVVEQFRNFPAAAQVPLEDLQKNPFSDPKSESKPTQQVEAVDRQAKLKTALAKVGTLKLQSIMFSDASRSCMINGKFQTEGNTIDSFTIERITAASVIVRDDAFRFELKAKN